MISGSRRSLLLAAVAGGLLTYGANYLLSAGSDQSEEIDSLESKVKTLEASLQKADGDLKNAQFLLLHKNSSTNLPANGELAATRQVKESESARNGGDQTSGNMGHNTVQALRNLEISPAGDSRSFVEKVNDLLSNNPTKDKIAVASKGIFDMARDRQRLPDDALQTIYNNQTDPDLKRVIAQVLSQRGNDTLLEDQVAKAQVKLKSGQSSDRQEALVQLAKMRNVKAADAILPLLHDPDTNVKLDALLALRNNGNAMDVGYVEMMRDDPNPAVSSLASDVANDLRDLSASARTSMSASDIEAGLPPM